MRVEKVCNFEAENCAVLKRKKQNGDGSHFFLLSKFEKAWRDV